jgi:hypothetical protein
MIQEKILDSLADCSLLTQTICIWCCIYLIYLIGRPVRSIDDLMTYIDVNKSVGDNVMLSVNRHGFESSVTGATIVSEQDTTILS